MYKLFVMLFINLNTGLELEHGTYPTMQECWQQAVQVSRSKEVFNVRCQLIDDK